MSSREIPYQCKECGKTFRQLKNLKVHWAVHSTFRPYQCPECKKTYKRKTHLNDHRKSFHVRERPHKCQVCDRKFAFRAEMKKHMISHKTVRNHRCLLCDKTYQTLKELKAHALVHYYEQHGYKCLICEKSYASLSGLRGHMARQPFECRMLTIEGSQKKKIMLPNITSFTEAKKVASMKTCNTMTDADERKHQCHLCGKAFKQSGHLIMHMMVHTGKRPHKCSECNATYTRISHLKEHQLMKHSGEKPPRNLGCGENLLNDSSDDQCPEGNAGSPTECMDKQCNQSTESEPLPQHIEEPNDLLSDCKSDIDISKYLETNIVSIDGDQI